MRAGKQGILWAAALICSVAFAPGVMAAQAPGHDPAHASSGGIKVSGYWKIDVRNADGTLASHTEFENALTPLGGALLAKIAQGSVVVRDLMVELDGSAKPCGSSVTCTIVPNTTDFTDPNSPFFAGHSPGISTSLVVAAQTTAPAKLVLAGLATTSGGNIGVVRTKVIQSCPLAPAVCDPGLLSIGFGNLSALIAPLTEFTLQTPITVTFGQVVSVSVTLTFSS